MPIAQQSKFACLKIDGDTSSDDEGKKLINLGKGKQGAKKNAGQKTANKNHNVPLLVHVVPQKPKSRGKKAKKAPQVVDETGLVIQDPELDPAEIRYREDLRQALKESYESSSLAAQANVETTSTAVKLEQSKEQEKKSSPAEALILDLDKEANKFIAGAPKASESAIRLYRAKLLNVLEENLRFKEDLTKTKDTADKYRNRYTKLCEILKDVEISEKAQLVVQLEKARAVENELGAQIGALRGELMQATSKNRELEAKVKELTKR